MRAMRRWRGGVSLYSLIARQTARLQAGTIALGLLLPPLAVVPLEMQKRIIDDAIPAGDIGAVANLAAVLAGVVLAAALIRGVLHYLQDGSSRSLRASCGFRWSRRSGGGPPPRPGQSSAS